MPTLTLPQDESCTLRTALWSYAASRCLLFFSSFVGSLTLLFVTSPSVFVISIGEFI